MGLSLGNKNIGSIYKGNKSIGKVYLGNKLIFQKSAPMVLTTTIYKYTTVGNHYLVLPPELNVETLDYLIVGGGGGGGGSNLSSGSGGGGAGGVVIGSLTSFKYNFNYLVQVGAGGAGGVGSSSSGSAGKNGGNSRFFNRTVAKGGGGGGGRYNVDGLNGGSGGGGYTGNINSKFGTGISGQGHDGTTWVNSSNKGGAGGGAGSAGYSDGTGGDGIVSDITGSNITYARGGDSGNLISRTPYNGINGLGEGGSGTRSGMSSTNGGNGGSGCVIIKITHWVPASLGSSINIINF